MKLFSTEYALLSAQVALLGVVTPGLRAVSVDACETDSSISIYFYHDQEASEYDRENWSCIVTEVSADFGPDCIIHSDVYRVDYPHPILPRGKYAYLRKEPLSVIPDLIELPRVTRKIINTDNRAHFFSPVFEEKAETTWHLIHKTNDFEYIIPAKPPSYQIPIFPIAYYLLALQKALLGLITPELRGIVASLQREEKLVSTRFYYDQAVSHVTLAEWECAITQSIASMGPDYRVDAQIERLDFPQKIPFTERYVYLREERSVR
jgi:hypothetical protein